LSIGKCTLIDCDVEEPNCSLFLGVEPVKMTEVAVSVPCFDLGKCTYCEECSHFCRYHAIAVIPPKTLLFFPELCHSCGGCAILCPHDAVSEGPRVLGEIDRARTGDVEFYQGRLNVGEPMATPIIRKLKSCASGDGTIIFDSPPGTSCPVIETIRGTDFCILVTEPTPFGLHDLKLAIGVTRKLGVPFGVVINRDGIGDGRVDEYCQKEGIPIMMRIPDSREIAVLYSNGIPFVTRMEGSGEGFRRLLRDIKEMIGGEQ
jgi:MinD superfamily P-loop ATPase